MTNEKLIKSFLNLKKDWDTYDSEPPNETAVNNALLALKKCKTEPTLIGPCSDEGITFEYLIGDNYYILEFYNDGDIGYLEDIGNKGEKK
jgi:hypothetical protein